VRLLVIDNSSSDGTHEYLRSLHPRVVVIKRGIPVGVARAWNLGLRWVWDEGVRHALVVNNDVELLPLTYYYLLKHGGLFVTSVGMGDPEKLVEQFPNLDKIRPHPDFSCYLIRKECWEKVGEFDENFHIGFCEDWDYHVRMHQAGIEAVCIDYPFLHWASQTVKLCSLEERERITVAAALNRLYFRQKWGFAGGSKEYEEFFTCSATAREKQTS
jgi:hypothetical protein